MDIRIQKLSFRYQTFGAPAKTVLNEINLEISAGEMIAIAGPSGSGKTTLMQHFTGLLKPDSGRVLIDGHDLWANKTDFANLRRRIGLVFQFPEAQLFDETVFDDVAFGLRNLELSEADIAVRVREAVHQVGLDFEIFRGRSPIHLSEGEKRRVALAGVLVMNPDAFILDEPTAALDFAGVQAMTAILKKYHAAGKTVVIISHNLDLLFLLVDRLVLMNCGKIQFDGQTAELLSKPEIVESAGLALPRVVRIAERLRNSGWIRQNGCPSLSQLFEEISLQRASVLKSTNG
jgi:energy-coupling factor transport system ATP-binding protein